MSPARAIGVVVATVLALLLAAAAAHAEIVNQVGFRIADIQRDGRFTLVYSARSYDTSGAKAEVPRASWLRLPAGATLRPEILTRRYRCDGDALLDALEAHPLRGHFSDHVANLGPIAQALARSRSRRDRRWLANVQTCARARVGAGTVVVDARPIFAKPVRSRLFLFLSRPSERGAVAALSMIGIPDERTALVRRSEILQILHPELRANFFSEPTPDGRFDYRLALPSDPVQGMPLSLARVDVRMTGPRGASWFTLPRCPASGAYDFEAVFEYDLWTPTQTKPAQVACPRL